MTKPIKKTLIFGVLFLILIGILKDNLLDTPDVCRQRVRHSMQGAFEKSASDNLFSVDRELVYGINYWSIIPMGTLKLSVEDRRERCISAEATTDDCWIGNFFQASALFKSYFQQDRLISKLYLEKTRVREKVRTKEILFDQEAFIAERDGVKMKIPQDTFDPVGAVVYAFTLDYETNPQQEVRFISKEDIYLLKATLIEKKNDIYKIKMEMKREDSGLNHIATLYVWVTADAARIPLLFKSLAPVGYMSVVLKDMKIKN